MTFSKYKAITYSLLLIFGLGVVITGCKKNNSDDDGGVEPEKVGYAEDQLLLEHLNSNTDRVVEKAFLLGAESLGSCVKIVKNEDTPRNGLAPDTMYVKFGDKSECLATDGKIRSGQLIISYNKDNKIREQGYYYKVAYGAYIVNGYMIKGYKEVTNVGTDASGNIQFHIKRVDTVVLPNDGGLLTGTSERTKVWYKGSATMQLSDDVFRTTGTGKFVRANGDMYTVEIRQPLYTPLSCNWITQGTINIFPEGATQRVLDYGEGSCENDATIDVNGVVSSVKSPN